MRKVAEIEGLDQFDGFRDAIGEAPRTVYFWVRDAMFRAAVQHRTTLLRSSGLKLNRRPSRNNPAPVQAPKVNEAVGADDSRDILWDVRPLEKRRPDAPLRELSIDIGTRSQILPTHEFGATISPSSSRLLPVPIKAPGAASRTRRSPAEFRKAKPKAVLLARKSKRSGTILLFERVRKRSVARVRLRRTKTGKATKSQPKVWKDILVPRWALLPAVRVQPRLRFYETWDSLDAARGALFRQAVDRIIRDVARGVRD